MTRVAPSTPPSDTEKISEDKFAKVHKRGYVVRSLLAFWVFGICNNFAFVVMLSAAQDILALASPETMSIVNDTKAEYCIPKVEDRTCNAQSVGIVLFMNIIPSMVVKATAPLYIDYLPFGIRHILTVITSVLSLVITAFATNITQALIGVVFASMSCGYGEITYLSLAAHYSSNTISTWSSGTGMAGVIGASAYAVLTDPKMLGLTPKTALLLMNFAPLSLVLVYSFVLSRAPTYEKTNPINPKTWFLSKPQKQEEVNIDDADTISIAETVDLNRIVTSRLTLGQKLRMTKDLLRFMIPFGITYFVQYFVNQGLSELVILDCDSSFNSSPGAQYRWFQVLFQLGRFFSRSSINLMRMPFWLFSAMGFCQLFMAMIIFVETLSPFIPHILVIYGLGLVIGLAGGWSYVNTIHYLHKTVESAAKEFALLAVSASGSVGVVFAALLAIPVHNAICSLPYYDWFH